MATKSKGMSKVVAVVMTAVVVSAVAAILLLVGNDKITSTISGAESGSCQQALNGICSVRSDSYEIQSNPPSCSQNYEGKKCSSIG